MHLLSLQIGRPRIISSGGSGEWWDKDWETGLHKSSVKGAVWLGYQGLKGDGVAAPSVHGGVDKAVCSYPGEHYDHWRDVITDEEFRHGAFGENFTTSGLLEDEVCVGDIFSVGGARVQVSQPRQPCYKIARRWRVKDLADRVQKSGKTGFYFRVLEHGRVQAGDALNLEERLDAQWTITACNRIFHNKTVAARDLAALASFPPLAGAWKDQLHARVAGVLHDGAS